MTVVLVVAFLVGVVVAHINGSGPLTWEEVVAAVVLGTLLWIVYWAAGRVERARRKEGRRDDD